MRAGESWNALPGTEQSTYSGISERAQRIFSCSRMKGKGQGSVATAFLVLHHGMLLANHLERHKIKTKITPTAPIHPPSTHENASIFERPVRTPAFGELCFNPPLTTMTALLIYFISFFLSPARYLCSRRNLDPGSQNMRHPSERFIYIYIYILVWSHGFAFSTPRSRVVTSRSKKMSLCVMR